ncbi:MAG: hypothetical protein WCE94_10725 [Candidatus Methanoperedens sp.]
MKKAIAWALGRMPKQSKDLDRMSSKEADVKAHMDWLKENEAVYFDHMWPCNTDELDFPVHGYLYIPKHTAIVFKLTINEIISGNPDKIINRIQSDFIPPWRKQCYTGKWSHDDLYTPDEPHKRSKTWIKVSKICELADPITDSHEIIKWNDGKPLESFIPPLRRGVYIRDGNWK